MSRNQFAAVCYRCGQIVEPNAGHFERVSNSQVKKWNRPISNKWITQHADCAVKFRGTDRHYQYAPDVQPWPEDAA